MSKTNPFRESKVALKDLSLWSENPRFPEAYFGKSESELINYIVSVPHYKIKSFGKEVVQDFDMPVFEKMAIFDGEGENIAYEGNRRLTVYKLLVNPDVCTDIDVRDYFHKLKMSINIDTEFKIDCVISENKSEILRYVNRKHLNNNNEVAWGTLENSNAKLRWLDDPDKVDIFRSNLSVIIRNLSIPTEDKNKILGRGFVTTLFRILNSRTSAKFFKLVFDDDNNLISGNDNFLPCLQIIIYDILDGKEFNGKKFSRLNSAEVEEYLNSIVIFEDEPVKDEESNDDNVTNDKKNFESTENPGNNKDEKTDSQAQSESGSKKHSEKTGTSGATAAPKRGKADKKTTQRKFLIPKDCNFDIKQPKINNIYCELKKDLLIDDSIKAVPNAVGISFRVFLEISLDYYAQMNGDGFKNDATISQKITWVVSKLKEKGYPDATFRHINFVGSSKKTHSYLSIEKFHQYVHDTTLEPSSSELKSKWDLLQPFFQTLWDDLKK